MGKLISLWILVVLLSGCAGKNYYGEKLKDSEVFAQQQKWTEAYSSIEVNLTLNMESEELRTLIGKYPNIISIGMKDAYAHRLKRVEDGCSNAIFYNYLYSIKQLGLITLAGDTKKEIIDNSKKGLNDCAANQQSGAWLKHLEEIEPIVGPEYFDPSTKKQAAITEERELLGEKLASKDRIGVIINVQVADQSQINTGTGANVGAAYAQARYIDNANWKNYSATKQLGAGLAGAVMGGLLLDTPTKPVYQSTYFVKLLSGDIKQVEVTARTATHLPEGVCVEIRDHLVDMVNQNNCAGL